MKIPDNMMIASMLSSLYGYDVAVKSGETPKEFKSWVKVLYNGDDGNPKALCFCDLKFANKSGAALTLIPPGMAEENVKAGKLPEDILENFREVVNVFCGLLNKDNSDHLVLGKIYSPGGDAMPDDLAAKLGDLTKSKTYDVTLRNYGNGLIGFLEVKG